MVEIGSYLYLARKDLDSAFFLSQHGDTGLFSRLCEQAVEKALKHFIDVNGETRDNSLLYIHKPYRLFNRCVELGLDIALTDDEKHALRMLDDYYFDTNYPGNAWFEPQREEVEPAFKLADKIVKHIEALAKN